MSTSAPTLAPELLADPDPRETSKDYGENNENLDEDLQDALKECARQAQQQYMYDRRREVLKDRRNREYERGNQHIYEDQGMYVMGQPGMTVHTQAGDIQCPNYIDDYNIFQPFCRTIQSVQTQNPPGIVFKPKDPSRQEDVEAAETAEIYRRYFNESNDEKSLQTKIIRMFELSGRCVTWTYTEKDTEHLTDDGQPTMYETCKVYGTLESKVPILAKEQCDCWYVILTDDPDVKVAKARYPKFAKKIKPGMPGIGETTYERIARLGVMQGNRAYSQINEALSHLVTRSYVFLRPSAFEGDYFSTEDDDPDSLKARLLAIFPQGCLVTFIGDVYVGSEAVSMDDCIHIAFPYEGDGMSRMAIMDPMVVVQDRFNDNMNYAAEVWDYGAPNTWVNADDAEWDSIKNQRADPYAVRQKKSRPNQPLDAEFYREPDPDLPPSFMGFLENLQGPLAQFITAAPPALFGGAMEDQKTASGYAQARNQAMGQQGLVWQAVQWAFAKIYEQAARWANKNPQHSETIVVARGNNGGNQTLQLSKLDTGDFGCFPDEDTGYPETTMQKRQTLTGLVTMAAQSPVGQQLFDAPDNWDTMKTLMGLSELVLPEVEARNKQALEIEELLQGSPIPPDPQVLQQAMQQHAAQTIASSHNPGVPQPPPFNPQSMLTPTVPVDPDFDFHIFEFKKVQDWLSSDAARKQIAAGNLAGIQNVRLHGLQHQKFAMQAMAAQAMTQQAPLPGKAPTPHPPPPPAANATNPQSTPIQ